MENNKLNAKFKELKNQFENNEFEKVLIYGVQFIEFCCDKIFNNNLKIDYRAEKHLAEILPPGASDDEVREFLGGYRDITKDILKSHNSASWKLKLFWIMYNDINGIFPDKVPINKKTVEKIVFVHKTRNQIAHDFMKDKKLSDSIKRAADNCLEICEWHMFFEELGLID